MDDQPRGYVPPPSAPAAEEVRPRPLAPAEPDERPPVDRPPPARFSRLRGLLWLIILVAVVAGIVWYVLGRPQPVAPGRLGSGAPTPVGTATVQKGDMPISVAALGTVTPLAMVTVRTQLNGQLIEVGFQEGQMVNKGDFLAQIDPRPYQVALAQAQGQLAKDQAALANAEVDLKRYQTLVSQNSVARQTLDTQIATVAQDRGTVQADQAAVDTQKLNLVYAHIVAPVSGRVGLRQVDAGNYVQTGDANGLVVITQLQPISVIFTVPEDNLPAILAQLHANQTLGAIAFDRSGTTQLETGQLATIDNQIDVTTGTVKLRAQFPNAKANLFPNQFVNVQLRVDTLQGTAIVPSSAIQRGAPGTFVYLVKPDNTVGVQVVTLGPSNGEQVAVTKGLDPGQVIVTDGADRLKDGAKVEAVKPADQTPGQQPGQPGQTPGQRNRGPGQQPGPGQQNRSNGG
jgi:membrane fusion protein, multidrug efflux system